MKTIILSFVLVFLIAGQGIAQSADPQKSAKTSTTQENETVKLKVSGLTCAGCASHLYKVLMETKGVIDNSVEYPGDIAVVNYDPDKIKPKEIIAAIEEKTSYKVELQKEKSKS